MSIFFYWYLDETYFAILKPLWCNFRALKLHLLFQDQLDAYDPALMFTIPRLAIVWSVQINKGLWKSVHYSYTHILCMCILIITFNKLINYICCKSWVKFHVHVWIIISIVVWFFFIWMIFFHLWCFSGLLVYPEGPLNPDMDPLSMSEMFRPFQTLLFKIRLV